MSTIKTWEERLPAILNTPEEIANARDAEITELREALKVEQSVNVLLRKTRETARAERDALQTQRDMWESMFKEVRAERDALQAKLSAIKAQEPELWARYPRTGRNTPPEVVTKKPEDADSWVAFYAHPVAPAQPVNELVEALNGAATSLETISRLAGKTHYVGDEGERVPTFMGEHSEVRGYAANRASVTRTALANAKAAKPTLGLTVGDKPYTQNLIDRLLMPPQAMTGKDLRALHQSSAELIYSFSKQINTLTKAAQPLTTEQVAKVLTALASVMNKNAVIYEAIEIMKGAK